MDKNLKEDLKKVLELLPRLDNSKRLSIIKTSDGIKLNAGHNQLDVLGYMYQKILDITDNDVDYNANGLMGMLEHVGSIVTKQPYEPTNIEHIYNHNGLVCKKHNDVSFYKEIRYEEEDITDDMDIKWLNKPLEIVGDVPFGYLKGFTTIDGDGFFVFEHIGTKRIVTIPIGLLVYTFNATITIDEMNPHDTKLLQDGLVGYDVKISSEGYYTSMPDAKDKIGYTIQKTLLSWYLTKAIFSCKRLPQYQRSI